MAASNPSPRWHERSAAIELLVLDVDGVLTDGRIIVDDEGRESKNFSVRDGTGLEMWRRAGKRAAILSGRSARAVEIRGRELKIDPIVQGARDKVPAFQELVHAAGVSPEHVCFVGDDLPDLKLFGVVGIAACPSDAVTEVRTAADLVTNARGGHGAVREVIENLLKAQGTWQALAGLIREPTA